MATVKTQNGRVLTKNGLVSCSCCGDGRCPSALNPFFANRLQAPDSLTYLTLPKTFSDSYLYNTAESDPPPMGKWRLTVDISFDFQFLRSDGWSYQLIGGTASTSVAERPLFKSNICLYLLSIPTLVSGSLIITRPQDVVIFGQTLSAGTSTVSFSDAVVVEFLYQFIDAGNSTQLNFVVRNGIAGILNLFRTTSGGGQQLLDRVSFFYAVGSRITGLTPISVTNSAAQNQATVLSQVAQNKEEYFGATHLPVEGSGLTQQSIALTALNVAINPVWEFISAAP